MNTMCFYEHFQHCSVASGPENSNFSNFQLTKRKASLHFLRESQIRSFYSVEWHSMVLSFSIHTFNNCNYQLRPSKIVHKKLIILYSFSIWDGQINKETIETCHTKRTFSKISNTFWHILNIPQSLEKFIATARKCWQYRDHHKINRWYGRRSVLMWQVLC